MAEALGGEPLVDLIVAHTHTCYTPDRVPGTPGASAAALPGLQFTRKRMGAMADRQELTRAVELAHRRRLGGRP